MEQELRKVVIRSKLKRDNNTGKPFLPGEPGGPYKGEQKREREPSSYVLVLKE